MSLSKEDDVRWAQACLEGNTEAVEAFQETFSPNLVGYLITKGALPSDAEDIVADLIKECLYGKEGREPKLINYQPVGRLEAWLNTCAYNKFRDFIRRKNREIPLQPQPLENEETTGIQLDHVQHTEPDDPATDETVEHLRVALQTALERIDEEALLLLRLVFIHGVSQRSLSRVWQCHEATISRKISAGMQALREHTLTYLNNVETNFSFSWEDCIRLCSKHQQLFL